MKRNKQIIFGLFATLAALNSYAKSQVDLHPRYCAENITGGVICIDIYQKQQKYDVFTTTTQQGAPECWLKLDGYTIDGDKFIGNKAVEDYFEATIQDGGNTFMVSHPSYSSGAYPANHGSWQDPCDSSLSTTLTVNSSKSHVTKK